MNFSMRNANIIALLIPASLLGGALISQFVFGLVACEMCHWQRWPHYAALLPALIGVVSSNFTIKRLMIVLVALLVATSGAIGVFHAGVEYGLWPGLTACTAAPGGTLADIMNAPITRCDTPAWTMFGVSMAGYNALISLSGALLLLGLAPRSR